MSHVFNPIRFNQTVLKMVTTRTVGLLLNFVSTYVLLRVLSLESYGSFVFFVSVLTLLGSPVSSAMMQLTTRMFSIIDKHAEAVTWVNQKILMWTFVIVSIGAASSYFNFGIVDDHLIFSVCAGSYFLFISSIFQGFNNGQNFVALSQAQEQLLRPVIFLVTLVVVNTWFSISSEIVVFLHVFTIVFAIFLSYLYGRFVLDINYPTFLTAFEKVSFNKDNDKAFYLFTASVLAITLLSEVNIILLKVFGFTEAIAMYAIAIKILNLVLMANTVIVQIVSPRISSLYFSGKRDELIAYLKYTTRVSFLTTLVLSVVIYLFAENLVVFFLKTNLPDTFFAGFSVLLVAQLFNVACGPVVKLLLMTGNEKKCLISLCFSIVLTTITGIFLIPLSPIVGPLLAAAIGVVTWNLILTFVVKAELGFNASIV